MGYGARASISKKSNKDRSQQKRTSFSDALAQVLRECRTKYCRLSSSQFSALAYLIWDCDAIDFEDRICALNHLAELLPLNDSEGKCAYSAHRSLRSFIRTYCRQVDLIRKEIFDSKHGIDFRWKLVDSSHGDSATFSARQNVAPLPFDDGYYGELDLCLEGALEAIRVYGGFRGSVIVTAQYWLCKEIQIDLEFSSAGELLRVLQSQSQIDCCALLMSLLLVEADESKAYWQSMRRAKSEMAHSGKSGVSQCKTSEGSSTTPWGRINPLTDIRGNQMLEAKRDAYCKKYYGTAGAFFSVNLGELKKQFAAMREILSDALEASNR